MSELDIKRQPKHKSRSGSHKRRFSILKPFKNIAENERVQKLTGCLLLFIISPYLIVAFTAYLFTWKADMSKVEGGWFNLLKGSETVENWLGKFGAIVSHQFIYNWFGITSFLFILVFFISGFRILFKISLLPVKKTLKYCFFSLIWCSVTFGYLFQTSTDFYQLTGGAFGYFVNQWLQSMFGGIGTGFLLGFLLLSFFIISFNISFNWFVKKGLVPASENSDDNDFTAVNYSPDGTPEMKRVGPIELLIEKHPQEEDKQEAAAQDNDLELIIEKTDGHVVPADESDDRAAKLLETLGEYDSKLDLADYKFPHLGLLEDHGNNEIQINKEELESNKEKIVSTLNNFNITTAKIKAIIGPTVTLYEIVPGPGIRISRIKTLEDDIALSLSALGIRIIAPIPGKGTVGIEVPNRTPEVVSMKSILASEKFTTSDFELPIGLGKTISNETFVTDLAKMPHLLMAGATGQGKSVGLNAILASLLYYKHPSQVKFVLIDPKRVELTLFRKIERHFLAKLPDEEEPIISDTKKVVGVLHSLCNEMDQRYDLLKNAQVRNLKEYNAKFVKRRLSPDKGHRFLPYIVLVIDEFADLIMTAGKEVESPITRLAQLARAIGIHLIIATQRPSVNIITGTIKANFPARIAFKVTSKIDSRTILDTGGADQLIGRGDMLLSTGSKLIRLQCAFIDTPEIEKVTEFIGSQRGYPEALVLPEYKDESATEGGTIDDGNRDVMFSEAASLVVMHQQGSTSLLQRRLKLGYGRAGRLIDQLESAGIIGPFEGSKARQVLIPDEYSLEQFLKQNNKSNESQNEN